MAGSTLLGTATSEDPARGSKRSLDEANGGLLRSSLEDLVARKNADVPLADIRDALMDHLLGSIQTDIKYTVLFVCEEVPDFRPQQQEPTTSAAAGEEGATNGDKAVTTAVELPLLEGVDADYQFRSRLSEGDSERERAWDADVVETAKPSAEFYVLSPEELKVHLSSIPFDDAKAAAEFASTMPLPDGETRSAEQLLLAIDCEMCRTTKGVELTRLTLIDASEKVLLDEYVRPKNPIVDYCTQYSGITCEIMEATTTRLADIQKQFLDLVPAEAILVGHSIENDLQALRVLHHRVIDTVCMYPHPKGPPFRSALRFLTSQFLNRAIQTGMDGHCSVEDAVATLQLAQLKIKHGPTFPSIEHEYKQKKVVNEMARAKKSVLIVDCQRSCRSLSGGVACVIPREAPGDVVQTVVHQLTTGFPPHLTWARVRGVRRSEVVEFVQKIKASLPEHSCLVAVLSGDTNDLRALHKRRTARTDPRSTLMWDKKQQEVLDATALAAQTGLVHICLQ
uniref:Exonuclease domain-containing protein n=1 Tax=Phytophthora ramorum TaxID=164328 RepID=H3H3X4_PHYRM